MSIDNSNESVLPLSIGASENPPSSKFFHTPDKTPARAREDNFRTP